MQIAAFTYILFKKKKHSSNTYQVQLAYDFRTLTGPFNLFSLTSYHFKFYKTAFNIFIQMTNKMD